MATNKAAAKKATSKTTAGKAPSSRRGAKAASKTPATKKGVAKKGAAKNSAAKKRPAKSGTSSAKMGVAKAAGQDGQASKLIDGRIAELGGWRGTTLARAREIIREADPEVVEEWKWRGVPVWSHGGIICTGETYKQVVKLTFHKGASLPDPAGLFNSSMEGNARRAIDIREGEKINARALTALVRAAVALNLTGRGRVRAG